MRQTTPARQERRHLRNNRRWHREYVKEMGRTPSKNEYVYRLEVEILWMPMWARAKNVPDLEWGENFIWLASKDRVLGYIVAKMDRENGGHPKIDRYLAKRCGLCGMLRVGELARGRQRQDESAADGRTKPCSDECMTRYHQQRGTL